jgi:hypothetical protein
MAQVHFSQEQMNTLTQDVANVNNASSAGEVQAAAAQYYSDLSAFGDKYVTMEGNAFT